VLTQVLMLITQIEMTSYTGEILVTKSLKSDVRSILIDLFLLFSFLAALIVPFL
jgi:hypothetical protein